MDGHRTVVEFLQPLLPIDSPVDVDDTRWTCSISAVSDDRTFANVPTQSSELTDELPADTAHVEFIKRSKFLSLVLSTATRYTQIEQSTVRPRHHRTDVSLCASIVPLTFSFARYSRTHLILAITVRKFLSFVFVCISPTSCRQG